MCDHIHTEMTLIGNKLKHGRVTEKVSFLFLCLFGTLFEGITLFYYFLIENGTADKFAYIIHTCIFC